MTEPARILLVDDDPRNLDVLESILTHPDCTFVRATSAEAALLELLHGEFAAIVLDVKMPGMNGLELAQLIKQRKRTRNIPILFLTAYHPDERDALAGYGVGAVDYLSKPLNPEILRSKVGVFVELFRKTRALAAANLELEDANVRLRLVNQELENFCSTVSHDLRSPLRGIKAFSEVVLNDHDDRMPGEARLYVERIQQCAVKMTQLVDDLLGFARLGRQPVHKQTVHMKGLVHEVLADLQAQRTGRDIELRIGELPDCEADAPLIRQVWHNLLANAHKFTRPHPHAVIELGSHAQADGIVYYVKDDGAGFDLQHALQLFQVFHRLHKESEFEGNGVGLSIVQRIVHKHGGRVWVGAAEVGKGATFCFTLSPPPKEPAACGPSDNGTERPDSQGGS